MNGASWVGGACLVLAGCNGNGGNGGDAGANRIVLFDGVSLGATFDAWRPLEGDGPVPWQLMGDGSMVVVPGTGNIVSRRTFESVFVHVEYKTPMLPANVTGQDRGNSGIYLKGMYEMQVLDSFGRPPEIDGAGALYGVRAPRVNASFAEELWNTYEIDFTAPTYDAGGNKLTNARVTAHLNGQLVQDDTEAPTSTDPAHPEAAGPGPLMLQEHQNPVAFRNIWVIPR